MMRILGWLLVEGLVEWMLDWLDGHDGRACLLVS